ncbi:MAG: UPF0149 family protein [Thermoanaerobaculia bacterium]
MPPTIPPALPHDADPAQDYDPALTNDELKELDRFLSSAGLVERSLDIFGLEGFLAALATGPEPVDAAEWMPWVWDIDKGEIAPEFDTPAEEEHILGLVTRAREAVANALSPGRLQAGEFRPIFEDGDSDAATNWCSGFVAGTRFASDAWTERIDERPKWFAPILGLGLEDGDTPRPRKSQIERWTRDLGAATTKIATFWSAGEATAADLPAVPQSIAAAAGAGRNEPCPCGSGKKFKRCCGQAAGAG